MNALYDLFGLVLVFVFVIFFIGLGFSAIAGQGPLAKRWTRWYLKTAGKITRRSAKFLAGLVADLFRWVHSKL